MCCFCRIELLLKGKGPGGMAPPFLTLGVDSDDESKLTDKPGKLPIPTSIDSDDDGTWFFVHSFFYLPNIFFYFFVLTKLFLI